MYRFLLIIPALFFFSGCINKHGISAKYYSDCEEYYDLQGYYHKECGKDDIITYKTIGDTAKKAAKKTLDFATDKKEVEKNVW